MTELNGNGNKSVVLSCLLMEPARMLADLAMLININNKSKWIIVSTGADFMFENKQTETDAAPVRYRRDKDIERWVYLLSVWVRSVSCLVQTWNISSLSVPSVCFAYLEESLLWWIFSVFFLILARAIKGYQLCLVVSVYFLVCIRCVFDVSSFHLAVT